MEIKAKEGEVISNIISPRKGAQPVFNIPSYQRPYSWKNEQCEELFEDVYENEKEYYLGSLVLVQNNPYESGESTVQYDTIDGQQRLTTISLLYAAIYEHMESLPNFSDRDARDIRDVLCIEDEKKLHVNLAGKNGEDFKYLIFTTLKLEKDIKAPSGYKKRRIYKNFACFRNKLQNFTAQQTKDLLGKLDTTMFVRLITHDIADAFTIFQSINDRGLNLSLVDIIKIEFIKDNNNHGEWDKLLEKLSDENNDDNLELQSRFFRHFYNAFLYKYEIKGYNKATKSNIAHIFKKLCTTYDASVLLGELVKAAEVYGLLNYPTLEEDYKFYFCAPELLELRHVQAKPAYLFLLYVFLTYPKEQDLLRECVQLLTKYFVRRNLTNFPATNALDKMFIDLINKCEDSRKRNNKVTIQDIIGFLLGHEYSSIETFVNALEGEVYADFPDSTRFLLCAIEQSHQTRESAIDLWEKKNNKYTFTIEHVLPEATNMHQEWIDMIADGNKKEALAIQEKCLHKLGNLTLSGYNSNLGKLPLNQKQTKVNEKGFPIGYNNGFYLNKILKDIPKWNEDTINERTERLIKEILKLFSFPGETHEYLK